MNRMRRTLEVISALLIVAILGSGCATKALWGERSYHPTDAINLALAAAPGKKDVLVQYDEQYGDSEKFRRRAYWLFEFARGDDRGKRMPMFVEPMTAGRLVSLPVLDRRPDLDAPLAAGSYAVVNLTQQYFELWQDGAWQGKFELPVYFQTPPATVWRIAVTPFAVLADGIIAIAVVAAVAAVVGVVLWVEAGAPNFWERR